MKYFPLICIALLAGTLAQDNSGQAALPPCIVQNCESNATAASGCNSSDVQCHCSHQQPIYQVLIPCVQQYCSDPASSLASYDQLFGEACSQFNPTVPAPGNNVNATANNGIASIGGTGVGSAPYANATLTASAIATLLLNSTAYPIYVSVTAGISETVTSFATGAAVITTTVAASATDSSSAFSAVVTTPSIFQPPPSTAGAARNDRAIWSSVHWISWVTAVFAAVM